MRKGLRRKDGGSDPSGAIAVDTLLSLFILAHLSWMLLLVLHELLLLCRQLGESHVVLLSIDCLYTNQAGLGYYSLIIRP